MEQDFVYWRHPSVPCIKIEEVTEGHDFEGRAWLDTARQVYCENGRDAYREIGHFRNGAPFLYGSAARISVTHCPGLFAVATLPDTPEVNLGEFSLRTCLGIDAERADRAQVLRVRERFLSDRELAMVPADDVGLNILAWTVKEAAYKAAFCSAMDLCGDIVIDRMPVLGPPTPVYDPGEYGLGPGGFTDADYGQVTVRRHPDGPEMDAGVREVALRLYSYRSDDFLITLAFSPRTATFAR